MCLVGVQVEERRASGLSRRTTVRHRAPQPVSVEWTDRPSRHRVRCGHCGAMIELTTYPPLRLTRSLATRIRMKGGRRAFDKWLQGWAVLSLVLGTYWLANGKDIVRVLIVLGVLGVLVLVAALLSFLWAFFEEGDYSNGAVAMGNADVPFRHISSHGLTIDPKNETRVDGSSPGHGLRFKSLLGWAWNCGAMSSNTVYVNVSETKRFFWETKTSS